jgi:two-component system response regulator NreC
MARLVFLENNPYPNQAISNGQEPLTSREIEVLRLIAQGYTNTQAAEKLKISVRTVEYHRSKLTNKLNLRSRVELMKYAEERDLI